MKISIELDTQHDDKCLINQVLNILTQNHHKCNCHHHGATAVKKEEPAAVATAPTPAPTSPEPNEPKKRRGPLKKDQIPDVCKCVVCNTEYKYGNDGLRSDRFCSKKCRTKYYNNRLTEKRRIARFEAKHDGIKIIPASQVQTLQVVKDHIPVSEPIARPALPVTTRREKKCLLCELSFIPDDPSQKFCNRCLSSFGEEECIGLLKDKIAKETAEKQTSKSKWRTCPKCAKDFEAQHDEMFCPRCTDLLTTKKRKRKK